MLGIEKGYNQRNLFLKPHLNMINNINKQEIVLKTSFGLFLTTLFFDFPAIAHSGHAESSATIHVLEHSVGSELILIVGLGALTALICAKSYFVTGRNKR